jgi:hypothetical protein
MPSRTGVGARWGDDVEQAARHAANPSAAKWMERIIVVDRSGIGFCRLAFCYTASSRPPSLPRACFGRMITRGVLLPRLRDETGAHLCSRGRRVPAPLPSACSAQRLPQSAHLWLAFAGGEDPQKPGACPAGNAFIVSQRGSWHHPLFTSTQAPAGSTPLPALFQADGSDRWTRPRSTSPAMRPSSLNTARGTQNVFAKSADTLAHPRALIHSWRCSTQTQQRCSIRYRASSDCSKPLLIPNRFASTAVLSRPCPSIDPQRHSA